MQTQGKDATTRRLMDEIERLRAMVRGFADALEERQAGGMELEPIELMWLADARRTNEQNVKAE